MTRENHGTWIRSLSDSSGNDQEEEEMKKELRDIRIQEENGPKTKDILNNKI